MKNELLDKFEKEFEELGKQKDVKDDTKIMRRPKWVDDYPHFVEVKSKNEK